MEKRRGGQSNKHFLVFTQRRRQRKDTKGEFDVISLQIYGGEKNE